MKRLPVLLALLLAACSSDPATSDSRDPAPSKTKHALVIGLDGVRVDALEEADTPVIDTLIAAGTVTYDAFAGGEPGTLLARTERFHEPGVALARGDVA